MRTEAAGGEKKNELQQHDDSSSGQENIIYSSSRVNWTGLEDSPWNRLHLHPARVIRDWLAIWKSSAPPHPFITRVTRRLEDYQLLR